MGEITVGTRLTHYNGSGAWGFADGTVTAVDAQGVTVRLVPRHGEQEAFEHRWTWEQFDNLVSIEYITLI